MSNTLITPSIIAKEALFQLENNCVAGGLVHRQYKKEFVKIGNSVTIRKPVKFKAVDGATRQNQDVIEQTTSIVIDQRKHVSWTFSSEDLTLTIEEYSERYIKPAMIVLSNEIDKAVLLEGARSFFNFRGTPGTTPSTFGNVTPVAQVMDEEPVPDDGYRHGVLGPAARWSLADGLATASSGIHAPNMTEPMYRKGYLGPLANFNIYGDQNIPRHTVGQYSGTPLVNSASFPNDTNVIPFDGMTGSQVGALKAGDVIRIQGVNSVNDVSKDDQGVLQDFVVEADVDTTGGAGNIQVYPVLNDGSTTSTAAYQTVSALPADNAPITIVNGAAGSTHPQNLFFHENALALVTIPLELPDSATFKARADWRGYSIRVIKDYDINEDEEIIRLDVMFGTKGIYRELGARLTG